MAVKDVKKYYLDIIKQYVEMKQDLSDYEAAVQDKGITEDQLADVKEQINSIKENADRIAYILYLLERPNRKSKKAKYSKQHSELEEMFKRLGIDEDSILEENKSMISLIKNILNNII